jgi:hypothetical protein
LEVGVRCETPHLLDRAKRCGRCRIIALPVLKTTSSTNQPRPVVIGF